MYGKSKMSMGIFLTVIGLVILGIGIYLLVNGTDNNKKDSTAVVDFSSNSSESVNTSLAGKTAISKGSDSLNNEDNDSYAKGLEFEQYVIGKFNKKYWTIKDWRGDKKVEDRYVESSTYPDLEMTLKLHDKEYVIAVECKWRKGSDKDGSIKWSYPDQLQRYRDYAKNKDIPVFVAIGIGGNPSTPKNVYIIPFDMLGSHTVTESFLKSYEHDSGKYFFYDIDGNILK